MRFDGTEISIKRIVRGAYDDVLNNHTMTLAAGLSYYFVLSLFPILIVLAAIVAFLPIPNLFDTILATMSRVVPADSMGLVRRVIGSVITPHSGILTFGILGTLWTASGGFAGLIEALNVAYDVPETRPIWKTRSLAIALTVVIGGLLVTALVVMLFGEKLGVWIAGFVGLNSTFVLAWPYVKWGVSIAFTVLAVEFIYYLGPNLKQRFLFTLPGAALGVTFWIGSSYLLGIYFRSYAHYNKTYGILGAAIALMTWLYWSWFAILIGAEINSELVKAKRHGTLELKSRPPAAVEPRPAWRERETA